MSSRIHLDASAVTRLLGDDEGLELVIKHQAAQELAEKFKDLIFERVKKCVENGLDWEGLHVANVVLSKGIDQRIRTAGGNYLRCEETSIRAMILLEVEQQLPVVVKGMVQSYVERAAKRLLETIKIGE